MERSYDFSPPAKEEAMSYEELVTRFLEAQATSVRADRPLVTLEDLEVGTIQRIGKGNY